MVSKKSLTLEEPVTHCISYLMQCFNFCCNNEILFDFHSRNVYDDWQVTNRNDDDLLMFHYDQHWFTRHCMCVWLMSGRVENSISAAFNPSVRRDWSSSFIVQSNITDTSRVQFFKSGNWLLKATRQSLYFSLLSLHLTSYFNNSPFSLLLKGH